MLDLKQLKVRHQELEEGLRMNASELEIDNQELKINDQGLNTKNYIFEG